MFRYKNNIIFALAALIALSGCATSTVNKAKVDQVKKVAVVIFTVPDKIEFRSDPKDSSKSLLQIVAMAAGSADSSKAASLSYRSFIDSLNAQGLPFKVISADEVKGNAKFNALYVAPAPAPQAQEGGLAMKLAMGFLAAAAPPSITQGIAPEGLREFGLPQVWTSGNPLMGTKDEAKYIRDAIEALGVDAALVIADLGYSFSCNLCVGATGSASTGSAFVAALVDKDGAPIMSLREWFGTSGAHSAMVAYVVNPLQHDSLFTSHGKYMGEVFAKTFKEALKDAK